MKTALVTGGSRGIGAATALELAEAGYAVAVNYQKSAEKAEEVVKMIRSSGGRAMAVQADISDSAAVERMFTEVRERFGGVDLLVNNAGISYIGLFQEMSDSDIDRLIAVNLVGAMLCSREAVKDMLRKKSGVIINVSSMWGEVGASCEAVYSAAKAGLIGFTKALAKELGPSGIRVNCVSPGVIMTDMNSELTEETVAELREETPLLRIGTPKDVARAVEFLASDRASFVTGQTLPVNGGIFT